MFDQTFVDTGQKTSKLRTLAGSFLLQSLILGAGILVPLIYTETLPEAQLKGLFVGPPPPATPTPKAPAAVRARAVTPRAFSLWKLVAPKVIPQRVNNVDTIDPAPDIGVPGSTGPADAAINPLLSMTPNPQPPAAAIPAKPDKSSGPVRIGGVVAQANLIHNVQPVYPAAAKMAHIQGVVEFAAVINKEGVVEKLQLLSGHPLLVQAARNAILQWRYRPTLLNGQPVQVATTITIRFTLAP
jgi:periplasmic protein TonB